VNFEQVAELAATRAIFEVSAAPSILAERTLLWLGTRFDIQRPANYFTHLQSLPLLALPWWLEESIRDCADAEFQAELMYATINFYYFTRILDDVMDGHEIEPAVLPAMHPFHLRFTRPYYRRFGLQSSFWEHFERLLMVTIETASAEVVLRKITSEQFLNISARKTAAAVIPMAAVCVHYDRLDLLESWENMFTAFGRWHQMRDDVRDWSADWQADSPTWLLSEAEQRHSSGESVPAWMGREGFLWAKSVMRSWMDETLGAASNLGSSQLVLYMRARDEEFCREIDRTIAMAEACNELLKAESLLEQV